MQTKIVGILMGTNCGPLVHVVDLFVFCYERDFMMSLSGNKDAETIEAFNSTSRCLDDLFNILTAWSIKFTSVSNQIKQRRRSTNHPNRPCKSGKNQSQ